MTVPVETSKAKAPDRRLRRGQRLLALEDFEETYAQGRSGAERTLVMWLRRGPGASLRLGVVASRVIGNAVHRNRAKRRLREAWRLNRSRFQGEVDVVLVARRNILTAKWEEVNADLLKLAKRAGLLA